MILVDTSVIADILTKDPDWFKWSSGQIERWANQGGLLRRHHLRRTFREIRHAERAGTSAIRIHLSAVAVERGVSSRQGI